MSNEKPIKPINAPILHSKFKIQNSKLTIAHSLSAHQLSYLGSLFRPIDETLIKPIPRNSRTAGSDMGVLSKVKVEMANVIPENTITSDMAPNIIRVCFIINPL
jgi:hypothetical protein